MATTMYQLSLLLKKEGPFWVAQCLEYDIAGQGKTIKDAQYQVERAFVGSMILAQQRQVDDVHAFIPPAPPEYWKMYGEAEPLKESPADPFRSGMLLPISVKPEIRVGG